MQQPEHIGLYINIVSHQIRRVTDGFSARYGLTGIQSRILSFIASMPEQDIFQKDIEKRFGIRRSSVTSVISNLEQNGFLKRQPVPGDARLKKLVLTESGMAIHQEISDAIREFEFSLNNYFSPRQLKELLDMLRVLIVNLGGGDPCCACPPKQTDILLQGKDDKTC